MPQKCVAVCEQGGGRKRECVALHLNRMMREAYAARPPSGSHSAFKGLQRCDVHMQTLPPAAAYTCFSVGYMHFFITSLLNYLAQPENVCVNCVSTFKLDRNPLFFNLGRKLTLIIKRLSNIFHFLKNESLFPH